MSPSRVFNLKGLRVESTGSSDKISDNSKFNAFLILSYSAVFFKFSSSEYKTVKINSPSLDIKFLNLNPSFESLNQTTCLIKVKKSYTGFSDLT